MEHLPLALSKAFDKKKSASEPGDISTTTGPVLGYFTQESLHSLPRKHNLYGLECTAKDLPATITNLRSIFPKNEPTITHVSLYNKGVKCMSPNRTFNLQELASLPIAEMVNLERE